jgi:hypothetical protein
MLSDHQREFVRTVVRTLQIIVGALAFGVVMFMAVVLYMETHNPPAAAPTEHIFSYTALGMAVAVAIAWLIVPGIVAGRMRQSVIDGRSSQWGLVKNMPNAAELGDVDPLAGIYQTRTIIGVAMLEGVAFYSVAAYMLGHDRLALYVAIALLVLILSQFPTVSRLESWLESELTNIEQMRQLR